MRFGVVGYGLRISSLIDMVFRDIAPEIKIAGVVDPNQEQVMNRLSDCDKQDVIFYDSLEDMVQKANLDALMIGTRCNLHAPYAIQAAKYDIPLYLEKPVAISMEQAVSLEKAYENSKCPVVVSFPLRVSPHCVLAKEKINAGAIGGCEHIAGVNYIPYGTVYWEEEYRNYDITQGLFLQKATHDLDYMAFLMNSPIVCVAAMATMGRVFGGKKKSGLKCSKCQDSQKCPESPQNRKGNGSGGILEDHFCPFSVDCGTAETGMNEDSSSVLIKFASGAHGVYTQVFFTRRDAARRGAIISGYDGTISFDWYTNKLHLVHHHYPYSDTVKIGTGSSHFGGDYELARDFLNIVRGKGKSRSTIQDGIQSVYACLAAKESVEKHSFINVCQLAVT